MNTSSRVAAFLETHRASRDFILSALAGDMDGTQCGGELLDEHLDPIIESLFTSFTNDIAPSSLTAAQAHLFIAELSVFARYNSQFLYRAANSVESACFELAHELRRNHLEEGGERGKLPAHYVLYSSALMADLGIMVNGRVPLSETQVLLMLHDLMVGSHSTSHICGGYYATEGVATSETKLLRDITDRYGTLERQSRGGDLPRLAYYYDLHLDEAHEAASGGVSVEASHADGIGRFIRQSDIFHLSIAEITDGFLQILEGMSQWWSALIDRAKTLQ